MTVVGLRRVTLLERRVVSGNSFIGHEFRSLARSEGCNPKSAGSTHPQRSRYTNLGILLFYFAAARLDVAQNRGSKLLRLLSSELAWGRRRQPGQVFDPGCSNRVNCLWWSTLRHFSAFSGSALTPIRPVSPTRISEQLPVYQPAILVDYPACLWIGRFAIG